MPESPNITTREAKQRIAVARDNLKIWGYRVLLGTYNAIDTAPSTGRVSKGPAALQRAEQLLTYQDNGVSIDEAPHTPQKFNALVRVMKLLYMRRVLSEAMTLIAKERF